MASKLFVHLILIVLVATASVVGGWALLQTLSKAPVASAEASARTVRPESIDVSYASMGRVQPYDEAALPHSATLNAPRRDITVALAPALAADLARQHVPPAVDVVLLDSTTRAEHGRIPVDGTVSEWRFRALSAGAAFQAYLVPSGMSAGRAFSHQASIPPLEGVRNASLSTQAPVSSCVLEGAFGSLTLGFSSTEAPATAALRRVDEPQWRRSTRANRRPDGTVEVVFTALGHGEYIVELLGEAADGRGSAVEFPATVDGETHLQPKF